MARSIGAFALAFALCALAHGAARAANKPPLVQTSAPPISLPIIANGSGTFVLAQQLGHGVYLNFFASWCTPCKQEAGTIERVTREFAGRNLRVIGVAVLDDPAAATAFVRAHGLKYPIVFDKTGQVGAAYRLTQLPLHVFIGSDGVVRQYVEGGPLPAAELRLGLNSIAR